MRNIRKSKRYAGLGKYALSPKPLDITQLNALMRQVFAWMWVGMGITATVASAMSVGAFMPSLESLIIIIIAPFIAAVALDRKLRRFSPKQAGAFFIFYAALTGLTLSIVFSSLFYPTFSGALVNASFSTAVLFGVMTLIGWRTRLDLSLERSYVLMLALGLLIATLANTLLAGAGFDYIFSYFSVLLFSALAANQREACAALAADPDLRIMPADSLRFSLLAALQLYLSAAKMLLIALASLFGRRREWEHTHFHHMPHHQRSHYGGIGAIDSGGGGSNMGGGGSIGGSGGGGGGSFTP